METQGTQQVVESQVTETPSANTDEDLITRASGFVVKDEKKGEGNFDINKFNAELEKLPPEVKEQVKSFEASLRRGADEKFQEAARLRQEAELLKAQGWDRDRVQQALNDPNFVAHINQLQSERQIQQNPENSGLTDDEWSYLRPEEKKAIFETRQAQVEQARKFNQYIQQQEHQRQHESLKGKYKNYDPKSVQEIYDGLLNGKVQANLEHLWKALDYEAAIKRSYELGRREASGEVTEKINASTTALGGNVTPTYDVPKKDGKVSGPDYFKQLALKRMKQMGVTDFFKK